MDEATARQTDQVRSFNRFYTRQTGLLDSSLYRSGFSLTEVRLLYELAHRDGLTARQLHDELGLDRGYLSRILKHFKHRGLVAGRRSDSDGRQTLLALTDRGRDAFAPLNRAAEDEIVRLLGDLAPTARRRLVEAMHDIEEILGAGPARREPYLIRPPAPGDFGWIIHRQAVLYHREYGWDASYEGLVAEIIGSFSQHFDPDREGCWVAERDGEVAGSVLCVRESADGAKLRLLYVEPAARGLGIGARLVEEVIRFARGKGYSTLSLWTNDVLVSARRIYQAAGFRLVEEAPHHSFGKDLVGQTWRLAL